MADKKGLRDNEYEGRAWNDMLTGALNENKKRSKRERFLYNGEEKLKEMLLTPKEKVLMDVLFGGKLTEEAMHILLEDFDVDHANQNYILMLSCLGYMKSWEYFPPEIIPRLKGVHRYYQVRNSMGIPWLLKQLRILSGAGIPVMLIKGMAMRAYYAKDTPRLMWDYDIAVPSGRYEDALRLLCIGENFLKEEWPHSGTVSNGKEELDLHHWIFKQNEEQDSDLWERAVHFDFYGIDVCVPSEEDMFLHQLDTQFYNWRHGEALERRIKWLYDCRCIWNFLEKKDLYSLSLRAEELHITDKMRIMIHMFTVYFPDLVEEEQIQKFFPLIKEYHQWVKAWFWCKKEYEGYKKFCSRQKDPEHMTLGKSWHLIRWEIASYYYQKPVLKGSFPDITLWKYFKRTRDLHSFREAVVFLLKYISRIRFRENG